MGIEETVQEVICRMQEFRTEWIQYSESSIDYFGGKAEAMDIAITIVKAAFSELKGEAGHENKNNNK